MNTQINMHESNSSTALDEPTSKLELAQQELIRRLRASGRTVVEMEPSDTTLYEATLPQGQPPTK